MGDDELDGDMGMWEGGDPGRGDGVGVLGLGVDSAGDGKS